MLLAGEPWAPEELTAWLVRWVVDRVAEREGSAPRGRRGPPASWDAARTALLAAALAEQDLDVRFLAPGSERPARRPTDAGADAPAGAAAAVAVALRDAAGRDRPTATTASGRHAVVGGAIAALATVPAADPAPDATRDDGGPAPHDEPPATAAARTTVPATETTSGPPATSGPATGCPTTPRTVPTTAPTTGSRNTATSRPSTVRTVASTRMATGTQTGPSTRGGTSTRAGRGTPTMTRITGSRTPADPPRRRPSRGTCRPRAATGRGPTTRSRPTRPTPTPTRRVWVDRIRRQRVRQP